MADDTSNNPYIRTYAKDVAALTGKEPEMAAGAPVSQPTVVAPPVASQAPAEADREAVLARLRERAAKDPVHESTLLPPTLPTPQSKVEPVAETEFKAPAPAAPVPTVTETDKAEAADIDTGRFTAPPAAPIPLVKRTPEAPPAPTIVPPAAPVIPPPAPAPVSLYNVSPIHTYTSDFSDRIDTKGASTFSVLAAQSDAAPRAAAPISHARRTGLLISIASIILVLIGGGGVYAAYWYVSQHATVPVAAPVPSLVFADDRQALTGEGAELLQALIQSAASPLPEGNVRVVYLTESTTTSKGTTENIPLSGGALIGALQLAAPDVLLRNIAPESTVGIVHAGDETRPFFILKVLSYESTFAGMLTWEPTMQNTLSDLYPAYPAPPTPLPTIATTTTIVKGKKVVATTTVAALPIVLPAPQFVDEVASNHNVRALKDGLGRTLFLYGYVDKQTLIIARDEAAFAELVNRLSATKQQ